MIPLTDITPDAETNERIDEAIARVRGKNAYILGEEVEAFEEEWAAFCKAKYCVAVSSGTTALRLALRALLLPQSIVAVPAFTFAASAFAVSLQRMKPRFVDVSSDGLIDPQAVKECQVDAVMPVHLYGQMAVNHPDAYGGLTIIEDACQAHGHPFHDTTACFSFYPSKNLGAFGDAGAIVTNDSAMADLILKFRDYGRAFQNPVHDHFSKYFHSLVAGNERMDAIQAAVLRAKLPVLPKQIEQRRQAAIYYNKLFEEAGLPFRGMGDEMSVWHLYVIRVSQERNRLLSFLLGKGILAAMHYPFIVPEQRAYQEPDYADRWPNAFSLSREVLSLPFWPGMPESMQEQVVEAIELWDLTMNKRVLSFGGARQVTASSS